MIFLPIENTFVRQRLPGQDSIARFGLNHFFDKNDFITKGGEIGLVETLATLFRTRKANSLPECLPKVENKRCQIPPINPLQRTAGKAGTADRG